MRVTARAEHDQEGADVQERYDNGLTHLSYDSVNSSTLQATTVRGMRRQVVVNDAQSVINDITDLRKKLPVINDMTDLSKGLLVINDTIAKITCVIDNLCGCFFNQHLMTCVIDNLYGYRLN